MWGGLAQSREVSLKYVIARITGVTRGYDPRLGKRISRAASSWVWDSACASVDARAAAPVAKRLPWSSQGGHGPIRAEQFAVTLLGGRVRLLSGPRAKSSIPCRQHAVAGAAVTSAGEEQSSPRCGPRCGPRREGRCPSAPGASPRPRRVTMSWRALCRAP